MNKRMNGFGHWISQIQIIIIVTTAVIGWIFLKHDDAWTGFAFWALTIYLASGLKILGTAPREVAVLGIMGKRTDIVVQGLALACEPFGIKIVSLMIITIKNEDLNFPISSIRTCDGVRMTGVVTMTVHADDTDDPPGLPNEKTAAAKLWNYYDMGGAPGVFEQNHETVVAGLQQIIAVDRARDWKWVETHTSDMASELLTRIITARTGAAITPANSNLGTIAGLGFVIIKLQVKLTPKKEKIIDADEDRAVELLEREAEVEDTETINRQAGKRQDFYKLRGVNKSIDDCRNEVMLERLSKSGKVTVASGAKRLSVTEQPK